MCLLQYYILHVHSTMLGWKELLLGEVFGLSNVLRNSIRACYLSTIWKYKNYVLFGNGMTNVTCRLRHELSVQIRFLIKKVRTNKVPVCELEEIKNLQDFCKDLNLFGGAQFEGEHAIGIFYKRIAL